MLGGITNARISQLVRAGDLIAHADPEGRYQYDRASVEALARVRAMRTAVSVEQAESRKAMHDESRARIARQREQARSEAAERQKHLDELQERGVRALETIAKCLNQR
jgi:multidrug resistance efflux pump